MRVSLSAALVPVLLGLSLAGCSSGSWATLWTNGVATDYSGGSTDSQSYVTGLTLSDGSLYASGQIARGAVYWKDGVETVLGTASGAPGSTALGIAVVQH